MEKVEAFRGMDGELYESEDEALDADELYVGEFRIDEAIDIRSMADRIGFHYEGQYTEIEVRGGLPAAIFVDDMEIEPTVTLIRIAMAVVRRRERAGGGEESKQ